MENFRVLQKKSEILELLANAPEGGIQGDIWQTLDDKRLHYGIVRTYLDSEYKIIVFESHSKLEFLINEPVYIRINHRNLIFKLAPDYFFVYGKKISTPCPDSAKAIESRGEFRPNIPENLTVEVVLKPLGEGTNELKVKLIDISKGGIGICVADINKEYLERNKSFKILSINDIKMEGHNEIKVKYLKKIDHSNVKCGLMLDKAFVDEIFDYICKTLLGK